jgi:hypothetical protein
MNVKELIHQEAFYQNFPLEVDKFIDYCKERGINVNRRYLEYLEKEGLFRPIMRVDSYYVNNTADRKKKYETGHVIDPCQKEFVPWNNFYEKRERYREEIVHSYYHPYQIYSLNRVLETRSRALTRFNIIPQNDESVVNIRKKEKFMSDYLPNNLYERWYDFQKRIVQKEIVSALGLETKDIDDYRGLIGSYGLFIDPLKEWYDLIKYITYGKRQKLKGKALLAQDFYIISDMLALLLEDLTGKKQLETGSISDTMRGRGKVRVYDKELNYVDRDVLIKLLREYGINPRPRLVLIVEGDTEEVAFPIIANAMGIPLERYGIQIINIQGVDKHPRELIVHHSTPDIYQEDKEYYIHPERTKVFLIFDNEGNKGSWIKKFIKNPNKEIEGMMEDVLRSIKQKKKNTSAKTEEIFHKHTVKYYIWTNSFEYDNILDNEELSSELNKYGEKHGYNFDVTSDAIKECRANNRNLDKFIRDKTDTSLNKREFGEQLGNFIAKEIKERTNRFENQRRVEKVLDEIIRFTV